MRKKSRNAHTIQSNSVTPVKKASNGVKWMSRKAISCLAIGLLRTSGTSVVDFINLLIFNGFLKTLF